MSDNIFESINFEDIIPADYNPRILDDKEYSKLQQSINAFGLVDPIIVNLKNNHIIGGHQRYRVMYDEYISNPSKYNNLVLLRRGDIGWVFLKDNLTIDSESDEMALNIALNKISGEWDYTKLNSLLDDLLDVNFDTTLTGFDDLETFNLDDNLDSLNDTTFNNTSNASSSGKDNAKKYYSISIKCETLDEFNTVYDELSNKGYKLQIR